MRAVGRALVGFGVAVGLFGGVGELARTALAQGPGGGPPPARVFTDKVRLEEVERWREVTGELRAPVRSVLAAQRAGLVVQLAVEAGDRVEAGRVIAKLDDRTARLEAEQARATLATRRAEIAERQTALEKARRDFTRMETSYNKSSATESELDNARSARSTAEAQDAQARSQLAWAESDLLLAEKRLDDLTIKAPFAGTVLAKRTEVGQWVGDGDPVAEVVALDRVDAWLDVPEGVVNRLRADAGGAGAATVQVRVPALGPVEGSANGYMSAPVSGVVPTGDPLSRLFPVRVRLENKDGRLRPGMSVVGLVPSGDTEKALTISKDALLRNEAGTYVYMDAGGVAAIAPAGVVFIHGERLVVRSPVLKEGMELVVEGNERMFPGQPLIKMGEKTTKATTETRRHGGGHGENAEGGEPGGAGHQGKTGGPG